MPDEKGEIFDVSLTSISNSTELYLLSFLSLVLAESINGSALRTLPTHANARSIPKAVT